MSNEALPRSEYVFIADLTIPEPLPADTPTTDLEESFAVVGMRHPIVVTPTGRVVFGRRRILAHQRMGMSRILAHYVDGVEDAAVIARMQLDENRCRRDPKPSEIVTEGRKIEAAFKDEARESRAAHMKRVGSGDDTLPEAKPKGRVSDRVGAAFGISGDKYEQAKEVVRAAEDDPGQADLVKKMDTEGKVKPAHRELRTRGKGKGKKKAEPAKTDPGIVVDKLDNQVPAHLCDVFTDSLIADLRGPIDAAIKAFDPAKLASQLLAKAKAYPYLQAPLFLTYVREAASQLDLAYDLLVNAAPHAVCPRCGGKRCEECRQSGYVTDWRNDELTQQDEGAKDGGDVE